jgi:hypothetical protein
MSQWQIDRPSQKRARESSRPTPPRGSVDARTTKLRIRRELARSRATKTILPLRQNILIVLRGRKLICRWDPRCGKKERSGVVRVGKAAAADLLSPGDVLRVSVTVDGFVGLN